MEKGPAAGLDRTVASSRKRRSPPIGFTLLELQLGILLFALAMTGLTRMMSIQGLQVSRIERISPTAGGAPTGSTATTTAPGMYTFLIEEAMDPNPTPSGHFEADITALDMTTPGSYAATIQIRNAQATDCGY